MISRRTFKRMLAPLLRARGRASMAYGRVSSTEPLSRDWGYGRGTPIDRYYIECFLEQNADDIRGDVLEIGDATYSRRFGGNRISRQDVLHVRERHPDATIVGDISSPGVLPEAAFDCIILTQTLHLLFDMAAATRQIRRSLRPGGVALITVPGISAIDRGDWRESWCWSLTENSLTRLLSLSFEPQKVEVSTFGNLFAATAFLHASVVEEVPRWKLDRVDPTYPVTVAARASA